jgi:hypothetical protein
VVRLPADVRPETELARVDVLAWGLRRLVKAGMRAIASPSVQVRRIKLVFVIASVLLFFSCPFVPVLLQLAGTFSRQTR